jgi:hypothetical protein
LVPGLNEEIPNSKAHQWILAARIDRLRDHGGNPVGRGHRGGTAQRGREKIVIAECGLRIGALSPHSHPAPLRAFATGKKNAPRLDHRQFLPHGKTGTQHKLTSHRFHVHDAS